MPSIGSGAGPANYCGSLETTLEAPFVAPLSALGTTCLRDRTARIARGYGRKRVATKRVGVETGMCSAQSQRGDDRVGGLPYLAARRA